MKINFTKAEYKALIELLYMGDWVAHAFTDHGSDENKDYKQLTQKIYAMAKQMGCEKDIEYAKKFDEYFPTRHFEEQSGTREIIDDYDGESFWTGLIDRLSERDMCEKHQVQSKFNIAIEDRFETLDKIEPLWTQEFAEHGIERLQVLIK